MTKLSTKALVGCIGAMALFAGTPLAQAQPGPAAPTDGADAAEPQGQYCVILVDKPADPNIPSNELFSSCSDTSIEEAESEMRSAETESSLAQRGVAVQAAAIPIMRWSENLNNSQPYTVIYGNYGPCDGAGYNLSVNSYWNVRITSMQGYNNCNFARMYQRAGGLVQDQRLPLGYVGDAFNDNIGRIVTHA